jgi:hypothetical protein
VRYGVTVGLTLLLAAGAGAVATEPAGAPGHQAVRATLVADVTATADPVSLPARATAAPDVPELPGGGTKVFGHRRFLVAYYGTAGTGALGVLGETPPDEMQRRLSRAAQPFKRPGERIQSVYELIVTVADPVPGAAGAFSHDIPRERVQEYIDAAHRNKALLVLDIQPGRTDFPTVVKRWRWALEDPWVGLALDPEWRMGPRQVPGRVIGHVTAAEVNRVSGWLSHLVARHHLPEKLLLLHQFRSTMIEGIEHVADRPGLAEVQHADGFGTQAQKLATYHAIARPGQFAMGFKLFYDEDVHRFTPAQVRRIRPAVRFVSYQ